MTGSRALRQAEPAERSPAVGREGRRGWREGGGLELTSTGTCTITCLLDRRTSGKTDTWTSRLQDKGAGRRGPSLLHNRKCHRHHQNGEGEVPLSAEGDRGEEESTSSVRPEEGPARQSGGGGREALKAPAHSSEVSFLSNGGSGGPGRPHWGVRFLFCTRYLSCWGCPRGGCRAGLFSEKK